MARLEQHREHLPPQILRLYTFEVLNLPRMCHRLVFFIAILERETEQIMQIWAR